MSGIFEESFISSVNLYFPVFMNIFGMILGIILVRFLINRTPEWIRSAYKAIRRAYEVERGD